MKKLIAGLLVCFLIVGCGQSPRTTLRNQAQSFGSLTGELWKSSGAQCSSTERTKVGTYINSSGYTTSVKTICDTLKQLKPPSVSEEQVSIDSIEYPYQGLDTHAMVTYQTSARSFRIHWVRVDASTPWYQFGPGHEWVIQEVKPRKKVATNPR